MVLAVLEGICGRCGSVIVLVGVCNGLVQDVVGCGGGVEVMHVVAGSAGRLCGCSEFCGGGVV